MAYTGKALELLSELISALILPLSSSSDFGFQLAKHHLNGCSPVWEEHRVRRQGWGISEAIPRCTMPPPDTGSGYLGGFSAR